MKDGIANNSTASISQARKAVEQLKMEACMDRIKVGGVGAFCYYACVCFGESREIDLDFRLKVAGLKILFKTRLTEREL